MPVSRLQLLALLALAACLGTACGDRVPTESAGQTLAPHAPASGSVVDDSATSSDAVSAEDEPPGLREKDLYVTGVSDAELEDLLGNFGGEELDLVAELGGSAASVPDPDTHFPIEGPRKGALFSLGAGRGFYEYSHNEHWGTSSLFLYDASMKRREWDVPPVLSV